MKTTIGKIFWLIFATGLIAIFCGTVIYFIGDDDYDEALQLFANSIASVGFIFFGIWGIIRIDRFNK